MPSRDTPGISNAVVGPVLRALAELGVTIERPPAAAPVIEGDVVDVLIDRAAAEIGDDAIGISVARRIPLGGLGDLDYALCTSETLRDGLARTVRFYGVVTERARLTMVETPGRVTLVFERIAESHSRHWAEFASAMIVVRMRQILGQQQIVLDDVAFTHPPPPSAKEHDAFFGTAVQFGATSDRFGFSSALLDLPLLTASAALAELLDARMRAIAPTLERVDPFLVRVRQTIATLLDGGDTGLGVTASRLGTSTRTLQRELKDRETSHKEVLDDVRRERAQTLLAQGGTVAEVAGRLGFSEPSAFFRAFRRWTGTSPRGARES